MYYLFPIILIVIMLSKNKRFTNLAFILFGIFFIIRFPMGQDIPAYAYFIEAAPSTPTFGHGRFFFTDLYYSIFAWISRNPTFFLFTNTLLCCLLIFYTIKKESYNIALSCFLFATSGYAQVYLQSGIRQALVMAVFLFAFYKYLLHEDYWKYALCILLVATYHDSALLLLMTIPLKKYLPFFSNKLLVILTSIALVLGLIVVPLIMPYMDFIGWYYEYLSRYSISIMGVGLQVVQILIIVFLYKLSGKNNDLNYRLPLVLNCLTFAIYLLFIGYPLVSRICDLVQIVNLIFIPKLLTGIMDTRVKIFFTLSIVCLNCFLLFADVTSSICAMNPINNVQIINYPYDTVFTYNYHDIGDLY